MARTRSADYDEKRAAIVDAAAKLFAQKGFAGASLSDIAAACETSKSLIYHYYPSKEAILYDVMNEHLDELLSILDEPFDGDGPLNAFRAFSRTLLRHYVGAAERQKVLLYEIGSLPKEQAKEMVRKERQIIGHAQSLIAAAAPKIASDRTALRAKTMLFFGMVNWTHNWFKPSGPLRRDDLADLAADTIIAAA